MAIASLACGIAGFPLTFCFWPFMILTAIGGITTGIVALVRMHGAPHQYRGKGLAITGIVSAQQLFRSTPYAVLLVFVAAAVLTPPDVISQVLLAGPMIALYLLGVGSAYMFGGRSKSEAEQTEEPPP